MASEEDEIREAIADGVTDSPLEQWDAVDRGKCLGNVLEAEASSFASGEYDDLHASSAQTALAAVLIASSEVIDGSQPSERMRPIS